MYGWLASGPPIYPDCRIRCPLFVEDEGRRLAGPSRPKSTTLVFYPKQNEAIDTTHPMDHRNPFVYPKLINCIERWSTKLFIKCMVGLLGGRPDIFPHEQGAAGLKDQAPPFSKIWAADWPAHHSKVPQLCVFTRSKMMQLTRSMQCDHANPFVYSSLIICMRTWSNEIS